MPRFLRLALGQINTTVGDFDGNAARMCLQIEQARDLGADLIAFPELAVAGYPPEDLLLKPKFIRDNLAAAKQLAQESRDITIVAGFVDATTDLHNAAAVLHDGEIAGVYHKHFLPNYGVFDENRYFDAGTRSPVFVLNGVTFGVNVCEDIWYPGGPIADQSLAGAELIVNINGSPYHDGKREARRRMLATRAADNAVILAYVNMVGGQDELVFDGSSLVFDQEGELLAEAPAFQEDLLVLDLDIDSVFRWRLHDPRRRKVRPAAASVEGVDRIALRDRPARPRPPLPARGPLEPLSRAGEVYQALVLGTGDYVRKNGFRKVLVGLSGGIDSSLVACVAADALGPDCVVGVAMPSRFSSEHSLADARCLAENLGIEFRLVPIEPAHTAYLQMLEEHFRGTQSGVAEENLQARIRGNILMALSNKFGWLVLTTGNKSEMATGYATLYGDMAGGYAVIKDVPKMVVYELSRHRNACGGKPVIPESVLTKPPSAELRPDQKDEDSLPPYAVLDPILQAYVEDDLSHEEIVEGGFEPAIVRRVIGMVDHSEYKRRQAPPGVKITPRAFGRDRRLPLTNRFRGA
jgi:NAD+ synthase (glutamine-hydrolysing)